MIAKKWVATYTELKSLIFENSSRHNIPVEIICGIISQESGWRTDATRYEPAFQRKYIDTKYQNFREKWRRDMATSWGLMQVMGITARELGFRGDPCELLNPPVGVRWGCKKLAELMRRYPDAPKDVISAYNAGSPRRDKDGKYVNQYYVNKVLGYAQEWGEIINDKTRTTKNAG